MQLNFPSSFFSCFYAGLQGKCNNFFAKFSKIFQFLGHSLSSMTLTVLKNLGLFLRNIIFKLVLSDANSNEFGHMIFCQLS